MKKIAGLVLALAVVSFIGCTTCNTPAPQPEPQSYKSDNK
jgi:hypothetical protein